MSEENTSAPVESAPVESAPAVETQETPTNFLDSVNEEYRSHPSLADFKDIDGLAKSYVNAQSMIGSSIRIPNEDSSPEFRNEFFEKLSQVEGVVKLPGVDDEAGQAAFYNKLGRPETSDGYKLEALEAAVGPELTGQYKEVAHKLGLSSDQAAALAEYEMSLAPDEATLEAEHNQYMEDSKAVLEKAWGETYESSLEGARSVSKQFSEQYPDAMAELTEVAGSNPALLSMMAELSKSYTESGSQVVPNGAHHGVAPAEALQKLELMESDPNHALYNAGHPDHMKAVNLRAELRSKLR